MQNDMRDRLVSLINQDNCPSPYMCDDKCKYSHLEHCIGDRLADRILADGWLRLPCKVGDTVYLADKYYHCEAEIEQIVIDENGISFEYVQYDRGVDTVEVWDDGQFGIEDIGTKVYLTLEDKEKAETDLLNMEVE